MRIRTEDLCFSYGSAPILKNIDFRAHESSLVAVIGPNGAGKSTLFRCILGFLKGYSGTILIDNQDIKEMSRTEIARKIAYIPQTTVPVFNYDVIDIVLMGTTGSLKLLESPGKEQIEAAERALDELGIGYLRNRGFGRISGGERQLVLVARALVQNAKILIMDEPTANLDYGNQYRVMAKIKELAAGGYTIILSTHNPEHALLFADKSFVIQKGEFVAAGSSAEVLNEEMMRRLYGVDVRILTTEINEEEARVFVPVGTSARDK